MKAWIAALTLLFVAAPAAAQHHMAPDSLLPSTPLPLSNAIDGASQVIVAEEPILIHDAAHLQDLGILKPGIDRYPDHTWWPTDSAQCHVENGMNPLPVPQLLLTARKGLVSHGHDDGGFPRYGELSGPITVYFGVKLFHVFGHAGSLYVRDGVIFNARGYDGATISDLVYDATGTATSPNLTGLPTGLLFVTGHFTFDPRTAAIKHGWDVLSIHLDVAYDNGWKMHNQLTEPYFSIVDPTLPVTSFEHTVMAECSGASIETHQTGWGGMVWQFPSPGEGERGAYLPVGKLSPITKPIRGFAATYGYGSLFHVDAFLNNVIDLDLHNGVEGTKIVSGVFHDTPGQVPGVTQWITIDPAQLAQSASPAGSAPGRHVFAGEWRETSDLLDERVTALFVTDVYVDPALPGATPVVVPNVMGLTALEARAVLERLPLHVGSLTQVDSDQPEGTVLFQDPIPGTKNAPDGVIDLTIAKTTLVAVPRMLEMNEAMVTDALARTGFVKGPVTRAPSVAYAPGTVMAQVPIPNALVLPGTSVSVVLADAPGTVTPDPPPPPPPPATVTVPVVVGLSQAAAQQALTAAGLTVGMVMTQESVSMAAGTVLAASPSAGQSVALGTAVMLTVAVAPPPPALLQCSGAVTGTMVPGGNTVTITSGTIGCK